jgi:CBS domain containing-hemolysin-like protein
MTPRSSMSWIDLGHAPQDILAQLYATPHNLLPVCRGEIDELVGVARTKDLIGELILRQRIDLSPAGPLRAPVILPETAGVLRAMETLKRARGQLVLVADEYGAIQGLLTPIDILEAIAGEFPDEDEQPAVRLQAPGLWEADGGADLHLLEQVLDTDVLVREDADYSSLAGFLLARFEMLPQAGQSVEADGLRYEILEVDGRRIARVAIRRLAPASAALPR